MLKVWNFVVEGTTLDKDSSLSFLDGDQNKRICSFAPKDVISIADKCMRIFIEGVK